MAEMNQSEQAKDPAAAKAENKAIRAIEMLEALKSKERASRVADRALLALHNLEER